MPQLALFEEVAPAPRHRAPRARGAPRAKLPAPDTRDPRLPPEDLSDEAIPRSGDLRWYLWTQPLEEFLCSPRDWAALHAWGVSRKVGTLLLRNLLSWLSAEGRAEANEHGEWSYTPRLTSEDPLLRCKGGTPRPLHRGKA